MFEITGVDEPTAKKAWPASPQEARAVPVRGKASRCRLSMRVGIWNLRLDLRIEHDEQRDSLKGNGAARSRAHRAAEAPVRPAQSGRHGKLEDPSQRRKTKKDIARIRTVLASASWKRRRPELLTQRAEHPWQQQTKKRKPAARAQKSARSCGRPGRRRQRQGDQTIKVVVNYQTKHPKYGKYLSAAPRCTRTTRERGNPRATWWRSPSAARSKTKHTACSASSRRRRRRRCSLGGRSDDRQGSRGAVRFRVFRITGAHDS